MRITKGFTLIEMVMVIVITGIIVSIVSMFLYVGFQSYFTGAAVTGLANEARVSLSRFSKELQRATSFSNISSPNSVSFTIGSGSSSSNVTYSLSGTSLNRIATSTQPLSKRVSALTIQYYDNNYAETSVLTAVKAVMVSITFSDGTETIPLITTVFLRNMS